MACSELPAFRWIHNDCEHHLRANMEAVSHLCLFQEPRALPAGLLLNDNCACFCVLINVLIALLWVLLDPLEAEESGGPIDVVKIIRDSNQSVQEVEIQRNITLDCSAQSQTFYFWFVSLHSYFFLMILLIVLVVLTRKIPQEQFQTEHLLHWDCASCFLSLLVMVVYMLLLPLPGAQAMLIRFIFFTTGLNIFVFGMCAFLFLPLFHSVYSHHRNRLCSCLKLT